MALWLCRLESDGLAAVGRDDSRARQLGIGAWVLPIQVAEDGDARWQAIQRCFAISSGLPLLLEWVIDRSCSLAEEQALAAQLLLWLDSHRALPLDSDRLLLQGTHIWMQRNGPRNGCGDHWPLVSAGFPCCCVVRVSPRRGLTVAAIGSRH